MDDMSKTDRLIVILSVGWTVIVTAYAFTIVRKQNIQKENTRITEYEQDVKEVFDVRMHREFHSEIKGMLTDINDKLTTPCD